LASPVCCCLSLACPLSCSEQEGSINEAELTALMRRKLVAKEAWKTWKVGKGPCFALQRKKAATELTTDMLQS
jgi:hypothetical protein